MASERKPFFTLKVAVVYFSTPGEGSKILEISKSLAQGLQSQGSDVMVEVIDGRLNAGKKLTLFQYIAIGVIPTSWLKGHIPEQVKLFLETAGHLIGKKSFAFVQKKLFGSQKTLVRLMSAMEKQGLIIRFSEMIDSPEMGKLMGEALNLS